MKIFEIKTGYLLFIYDTEEINWEGPDGRTYGFGFHGEDTPPTDWEYAADYESADHQGFLVHAPWETEKIALAPGWRAELADLEIGDYLGEGHRLVILDCAPLSNSRPITVCDWQDWQKGRAATAQPTEEKATTYEYTWAAGI